MKHPIICSCVVITGVGLCLFAADEAKNKPAANAKPGYRTSPVGYDDTPLIPGQKWRVHDINRPRPAVVAPGKLPGQPPSDAIVLFDGKDLSKWVEKGKDGEHNPPRWKIGKGYFEVTDKTGSIETKEKFGNIQLHVEFATPTVIDGDSQWRGNSGIVVMKRYEIQVLDSYSNKTYADGQVGAIYGQWPPLVNASRPPGEWQTYDIVWEAPKFSNGKLAEQAYATVFLNGVLLHNRQRVEGQMAHRIYKPYEPHGPEEPLQLQNHDTHVRYRNIWVRRLKGYDQP